MEIFDLKQKIVSLIRSLEQLKRQRDGLDHQLKLMVSIFDFEMPYAVPFLTFGNFAMQP